MPRLYFAQGFAGIRWNVYPLSHPRPSAISRIPSRFGFDILFWWRTRFLLLLSAIQDLFYIVSQYHPVKLIETSILIQGILRSWPTANESLRLTADIHRPLCVALGPTLDWFLGYQSANGQLKWIRGREKRPKSKHGAAYDICKPCRLVPVAVSLSTMMIDNSYRVTAASIIR